MADDSLLGTSLDVELDGQTVTGKVTAVHADRLEVSLRIQQTAKAYIGQTAKVTLDDGRVVTFDLGERSTFTRMVVEVPLPRPSRRDEPDEPEGDERRRYFRLGVNIDVEVLEELANGKDYVRTRGTTVNLSGGGMLVDLDRPMIAGVHTFRLHLPTETLVTEGRVVKLTKGPSTRTAVEFLHMPEADRSKVVRFIFKKMRNLKEGVEEEMKKKKETGELPRYWIRRLKYYQPPKIRYW